MTLSKADSSVVTQKVLIKIKFSYKLVMTLQLDQLARHLFSLCLKEPTYQISLTR